MRTPLYVVCVREVDMFLERCPVRWSAMGGDEKWVWSDTFWNVLPRPNCRKPVTMVAVDGATS